MSPFRALSVAIAKDWTRDRIGLFFSFAFPLVFLVIFGLIFHGQSYHGRPYISFIAPGVMCWAVANGSMFWVAYWAVEWRETGVLRRIRLSPVSLGTLLSSRYVISIGSGLIQVVFFIAIALLPFFGLSLAASAAIAILPLFLGMSAFFGIGLLIGATVRSAGAVTAVGNIVILPMAFLSGTFVPLAELPKWLQDVTYAFPLRYMLDSVDPLLGGHAPLAPTVWPILVLFGCAAVFGLIALRTFRWNGSER